MKKLWLILCSIALLLALTLFLMNPADGRLQSAAGQHAFEALKSRMPGQQFRHPQVEQLAREAARKGITIENYYLYKEVRFTFRGETRAIGYGYLNGFHPIETR